MKDNKKLSRQVTITIPSELLNKYKSIEYLRNAFERLNQDENTNLRAHPRAVFMWGTRNQT